MKLTKLIPSLLVLALGSAGSLLAQDAKQPAAPAPAAPAVPAVKFTEAQILETLGWFIGKQNSFSELGFTKEQVDMIVKGIQSAAAGKDTPYELEKIGPEIQNFMQTKQNAYFTKLKEQGKVEADKLFAELKTNKAVTFLPSGVAYEILKPGTGVAPKPTDTVKIDYTGKLANGTTFDTSIGREPLSMPLNGFIPGFTEGMQKTNKGGKIKLYIPAHLGYGENGNRDIPPNSALVFEVELLDIIAPPPPPPAPAAPAAPGEVKK